jgi:hypothetical protein
VYVPAASEHDPPLVPLLPFVLPVELVALPPPQDKQAATTPRVTTFDAHTETRDTRFMEGPLYIEAHHKKAAASRSGMEPSGAERPTDPGRSSNTNRSFLDDSIRRGYAYSNDALGFWRMRFGGIRLRNEWFKRVGCGCTNMRSEPWRLHMLRRVVARMSCRHLWTVYGRADMHGLWSPWADGGGRRLYVRM